MAWNVTYDLVINNAKIWLGWNNLLLQRIQFVKVFQAKKVFRLQLLMWIGYRSWYKRGRCPICQCFRGLWKSSRQFETVKGTMSNLKLEGALETVKSALNCDQSDAVSLKRFVHHKFEVERWSNPQERRLYQSLPSEQKAANENMFVEVKRDQKSWISVCREINIRERKA